MPALRDGRLDRSGYVLEFDEHFEGVELDRSRWFPWYLPQWSSRERTAARYSIADGALRLRSMPTRPSGHLSSIPARGYATCRLEIDALVASSCVALARG